MVVDSCTRDGVNLPAALLDHLGLTTVDAVVLSHPDLDHIRGIAEVVRRFPPGRIFRYPRFSLVRDLVAKWCVAHPAKPLYRELAEAIATIEAYEELDDGRVIEPCFSTRSWPDGAAYAVHFLAPTNFDQNRLFKVWTKLVVRKAGRYVLSKTFERILNGETKLGDVPNVVSLGIVLEWAGRKVLLAGDVENGKRGAPKSGWKGVLRDLDDPDHPRGHLVDDVELVKVAHHGSTGAFYEGAWRRHAKSRKSHAILAPYSPSSLPSDPILLNLRAYCVTLGVTADGGDSFARARRAGWSDVPDAQPSTTAPCVVAVLDVKGLALFRGSNAALFQ
jgi:hypothetical protein